MKNVSSAIKASRKIGLFGGTFDPIHNGHLIIAESVREQAGLDTVLFIPSAKPPHKHYELMFSSRERYNMISAAVNGNPGFAVTDIEMNRKGRSYTIDTIREIKSSFDPSCEFSFIVGKDNLYEIEKWKDPHAIVEKCVILVADRLCEENRPVPAWLAGHMKLVKVPIIEISSSAVRQALREGRSIRYLVPEAVYEMIQEYSRRK